MAQDYARNQYYSPRRKPQGRKPQRSSHALTWLLVGVILGFGLALALYFYLNHAVSHGTPPAATQRALDNLEKKKINNEHPEKTTSSSKPRFDFYTVLPANTAAKVEVVDKPITDSPDNAIKNTVSLEELESARLKLKNNPVQTNTVTLPKPVVSPPPVVDKAERYWVQVGSYSSYAAADGMRAQLLLADINVKIQTVKNAKGTLYQINFGPYPNKKSALKMQQNLQSKGIKSVLLVVN